jgi:hypothetical protein
MGEAKRREAPDTEPEDLQAMVERYGGYDMIPPEALEAFDRRGSKRWASLSGRDALKSGILETGIRDPSSEFLAQFARRHEYDHESFADHRKRVVGWVTGQK